MATIFSNVSHIDALVRSLKGVQMLAMYAEYLRKEALPNYILALERA